jgi:hypothetical protein
LPRSATGQVVITSRTGVGWERLASVLPIDVLAPNDAAELLLTRARETGPEAEAAAPTLATTLDGLPLALEQAGARDIHEQALSGYRWVLGDDHPDTQRSIKHLEAVRRELGEL